VHPTHDMQTMPYPYWTLLVGYQCIRAAGRFKDRLAPDNFQTIVCSLILPGSRTSWLHHWGYNVLKPLTGWHELTPIVHTRTNHDWDTRSNLQELSVPRKQHWECSSTRSTVMNQTEMCKAPSNPLVWSSSMQKSIL
jgi:hypothetical protein